jgi:hypothetical protein
LEEENGIVVTVKAKNVPELIEKLKKVLGEYKGVQPAQQQSEIKQEFPEEITRLYPDFDFENNQHSAAMLTVLYEKYQGKDKAVCSEDLALEMLHRFPTLFAGRTKGEVSRGNAFAGQKLAKKNIIKTATEIEKGTPYKIYWIEPKTLQIN